MIPPPFLNCSVWPQLQVIALVLLSVKCIQSQPASSGRLTLLEQLATTCLVTLGLVPPSGCLFVTISAEVAIKVVLMCMPSDVLAILLSGAVAYTCAFKGCGWCCCSRACMQWSPKVNNLTSQRSQRSSCQHFDVTVTQAQQ